MSSLGRTLAEIADALAEAVLSAIRGSLEDLRHPAAQRTARRTSPTRRRSAPPPAPSDERILAALTEMGTPMDLGTLAADLGVPADALKAPLRRLRASGAIAMHGQRRHAAYALVDF